MSMQRMVGRKNKLGLTCKTLPESKFGNLESLSAVLDDIQAEPNRLEPPQDTCLIYISMSPILRSQLTEITIQVSVRYYLSYECGNLFLTHLNIIPI